MNEPTQLMSNCVFKGKEYLVKMVVTENQTLELTITEKLVCDTWICSYDAAYIQSLTHKTGNYKPFDVFVAMLKSGLLKTSDTITLDFVSYDDLSMLRSKRVINFTARPLAVSNASKRYLILTYSVEFDRIHYPLGLDYGGTPDPVLLQNNIRKLEAEVDRLKVQNPLEHNRLNMEVKLQQRIDELSKENETLSDEISRLNSAVMKRNIPKKQNQILQSTLRKLEEQVLQERNHFKRVIWRMQQERDNLHKQIETLKQSDRSHKLRLQKVLETKLINKVPQNNMMKSSNQEMKYSKKNDSMTCHPISSWSATTQTRKSSRKRLGAANSPDTSTERMREPRKPAKPFGPTAHRQNSAGSYGVQTEILKPARPNRVQSRSSSAQSYPNARSSGSSRASSSSKISDKRGTHGDADRSRKQLRQSRKQNYANDCKLDISDIEKRIKAIQNLLAEGLNIN